MSRRIVLAAAAVALALASCAHDRLGVPHSATKATCNTASPGAQCKVNIVEDASGPYSCALGKFRVEPDLLELTGRRTAFIRWTLADKFGFCASEGDGTSLKWSASGHHEVFESYASDTEDGARLGLERTARCKSHFNWTWRNDPPGAIYAYEIRFHDKTTMQLCKIDPWIRNG